MNSLPNMVGKKVIVTWKGKLVKESPPCLAAIIEPVVTPYLMSEVHES